MFRNRKNKDEYWRCELKKELMQFAIYIAAQQSMPAPKCLRVDRVISPVVDYNHFGSLEFHDDTMVVFKFYFYGDIDFKRDLVEAMQAMATAMIDHIKADKKQREYRSITSAVHLIQEMHFGDVAKEGDNLVRLTNDCDRPLLANLSYENDAYVLRIKPGSGGGKDD